MIKDTSNNGSSDLYQIKFKTKNWLSIYITNKSKNNRLYIGIIIRDYGTFNYV